MDRSGNPRWRRTAPAPARPIGTSSAWVPARMPAVRPAVPRLQPALAPPTGLSAVAAIGSVTLTWQPVAYAASYIVERAHQADGPFETLAAVGTQTIFVDRAGPVGRSV